MGAFPDLLIKQPGVRQSCILSGHWLSVVTKWQHQYNNFFDSSEESDFTSSFPAPHWLSLRELIVSTRCQRERRPGICQASLKDGSALTSATKVIYGVLPLAAPRTGATSFGVHSVNNCLINSTRTSAAEDVIHRLLKAFSKKGNLSKSEFWLRANAADPGNGLMVLPFEVVGSTSQRFFFGNLEAERKEFWRKMVEEKFI